MLNCRVSRPFNFYRTRQSSGFYLRGPDMKSGPWKLGKLTKVARNAATRFKPRGKKMRVKRFNIILQALRYFCTQTSLHGLRYVVDPDLHGIERFLWFVLFVIFCTTASKVIVQLADRFQVSHRWKV